MQHTDLLWYYINQRHQIYLNREANKPWPWTTDPILQKFKFTNVFRELDKTTVWLRQNIRTPYQDWGPILLFNIALFRMYGCIESGMAHGFIKDWDPDEMVRKDTNRLNTGYQVFTGAYVISTAGRTGPKIDTVVHEFLTPLWRDKTHLYDVARRTRSLRSTFEVLKKYVGWGGEGFMAYELVTDLRHTPILSDATDIMTWANAGPGALRGLNRYHSRIMKKVKTVRLPRQPQALAEMRALLAESRSRLGDHVPRLEMRDVEHNLCEWDKYCRVFYNEGTPRSLYRPPRTTGA